MKSLAAVRAILLASSAVTAKRAGGVHTNAIPAGDGQPNVQLMLVSGLEEFTHGGPLGLVEDRVRIWCRGKTAREAAELSAAVDAALQGYVGTIAGATIQLCHRVMMRSDYQDAAEVHRAIADYDVHWEPAG